MARKILLSIFILFTSFIFVNAETYVLTLDESIEIAKAKSYTILTLEQDLKMAEYNLKSALNSLKTNINLTLGLPQYDEEVRQFEDSTGISYYNVKQLKYSSHLTINQPLPTNGNIFIQTGLTGFDDFYSDIRSANLNTRIGFSQNIDAFYAYNSIKSQIKVAELNYERTNKSLKRQELELVYEVSRSYYDLLMLQKSKEIAFLNLERQTEAYEISKNKYEAGLIREVDALQMEVDLAEAQSNYDISILNEETSTNNFKNLLGINLDDDISLQSELKYEIFIIDPERAIQWAIENRSELKEKDIQIAIQELEVKRQRSAGMVKGNVNAYIEKVGVNRNEMAFNIPHTIRKSYDNFSDRRANYGVGFTLSIPILDWGVNRSLVRSERARLKQLNLEKEDLERTIETGIRNLVLDINSNLKRLQLLERNVDVAEKSFEITLQRFSDGDIDSQSLALERNRLNNAYTSHLSAYINYQLSLADFMRKTLYDIRTDRLVE